MLAACTVPTSPAIALQIVHVSHTPRMSMTTCIVGPACAGSMPRRSSARGSSAPTKTKQQEMPQIQITSNTAKPEKGMQGSGAIGERLMVGDDPQNDTASQRSWLYSEDVMFSAPKERKEETRIYATLPIRGDGGDARPAPRVNDTIAPGMNVFSNKLVPSI